MKTPLISVVVPIYNVERYIKVCIDSILAQTFQDFEIIIVDDASPDNSYNICQKLYGGNEKVRIVRHEKNQGLGPARNTGIEYARGKYILFVDSDDFILPNALEILYAVAEGSGAEIVHASQYYETTQDDDKPIDFDKITLEKDPHQIEGFITTDILYRWENCWQHWNDADGIRPMAVMNLYRREIFEKYPLKFEPIISEDELFAFEFFAYVKKFFVINQSLYVYRRREGSLMKSKNPQHLAQGILAFIVTIDKLKSVMNRFSKLRGNTEIQEHFIFKILDTHHFNHIRPFYKQSLTQEIEFVVNEILQEIFGENKTFVKYFFNIANEYRILYENLLAQANQLYNDAQILTGKIMDTLHRCPTVKNKVIFINFNGKGYGCNPKYIAEEILRQNLPYDLVWLVNDLNEPLPEKIRKVQFGSVDATYELSTAKVIISNVKSSLPFTKKPDQFFIMTWHGDPGFASKEIEAECESQLHPRYVAESKQNSAITDLMLTCTDKGFDLMRNYFWYDGEIMKSGLPRNDILFNATKEFVANIKNQLNIPLENKILIYAPTFRNDSQESIMAYKFDAEKLLTLMKEKFGGEWTLLLRFHPNISSLGIAQTLYKMSDKIIDVTQYPDNQELLVISDILISDYSSVIPEFMIQHKPIFIFAKDVDTYPKERRLKPFYFELPLDKNKTEDELFECIKNFDADDYSRKIKNFMSKTFEIYDDGHASERVVDVIKSVISS